MLLETEADLVMVLGAAAGILLFLALACGVIATLKTFQVRQFQTLLHNSERKVDNLERRIFNVLNAVPVALVETDLTGKFTFANKAAHQLLGRKDSELIGLRFHSATWGITYPDGRMIPPDLLPIARTLRGQTVKGFQHMLAHPVTRGKVLISVTSMPIVSPHGEITGSSAAFVEIESQAGEGIGDITGVWRGHWFTAASVPFWGLDLAGKVLDLNGAAVDVLSTTRDDSLGQSWAQSFVSDTDFQRAVDYLAEVQADAAAHNPPAPLSLSLKRADGTAQTVMVSAWKVRTPDGADQGLTVMAVPAPASLAVPAPNPLDDDAAQALEDLRQAEKARADLGVGVWVYDRDADTIVEDEGMRRLIGRETPGGPTLISDEDQAIADKAFAALMAGETDTLDIELRVGPKGQPLRFINLKGRAETRDDGTRDVSGIALDISDYRTQIADVAAPTEPAETIEQIEARLRPALEAELLNRAESDIAGQIEAAITSERTRMEQVMADAVSAAQETATAEAQSALMSEIEALKARPEPEPEPEPVAVPSARDVAQTLAKLTRVWTLRSGTPTLISLSADWHDLTGLMAHEFMGEGFLDCVHPDDQTELFDTLKDFMTSSRGGQISYRVRNSEGNYVRLIEQVTPSFDNGVFDGLIGMAFEIEHLMPAPVIEAVPEAAPEPAEPPVPAPVAAADVAELAKLRDELDDLRQSLNSAIASKASLEEKARKLDEALQQAQKYETAGRLTFNVANDFGQMLHVINGALDMMQKQSNNPENIRRLSEAALVAGKRGERLTRQLQAFTQSDED
ncbi:PAS domain-containing protein [Asticcacaulis sp. SL142]|uniref:PAS domain-containing protein n=1 Tax=Asticcacaulis sp. SL142 TaxID=2995155 RepID=UPI00226CA718|nr:PAS domain-containing protein [Asticcacaulis sp. SL142]WAC47769.1 PAS domain-containing protein [Asticcacaulis sp. SL142]